MRRMITRGMCSPICVCDPEHHIRPHKKWSVTCDTSPGPQFAAVVLLWWTWHLCFADADFIVRYHNSISMGKITKDSIKLQRSSLWSCQVKYYGRSREEMNDVILLLIRNVGITFTYLSVFTHFFTCVLPFKECNTHTHTHTCVFHRNWPCTMSSPSATPWPSLAEFTDWRRRKPRRVWTSSSTSWIYLRSTAWSEISGKNPSCA